MTNNTKQSDYRDHSTIQGCGLHHYLWAQVIHLKAALLLLWTMGHVMIIIIPEKCGYFPPVDWFRLTKNSFVTFGLHVKWLVLILLLLSLLILGHFKLSTMKLSAGPFSLLCCSYPASGSRRCETSCISLQNMVNLGDLPNYNPAELLAAATKEGTSGEYFLIDRMLQKRHVPL